MNSRRQAELAHEEPQNGPSRHRSLAQKLFYRAAQLTCQFVAVFLFNMRCFGRQNIPAHGAALILSTHQSHFDPVMIGISFNKPLNYLARKTLFDNWLLGTVIYLLDAIELDRGRGGLEGLKEALRRLKQGESVLIFPEGTRTTTGKMQAIKPGFVSLAKRTRVPLLPVAIAGAFYALPRGARVPVRHPLRLAVGKAIPAEEVAQLSDDQVLELVIKRLQECDSVARHSSK